MPGRDAAPVVPSGLGSDPNDIVRAAASTAARGCPVSALLLRGRTDRVGS
jgi:hypothetical protein